MLIGLWEGFGEEQGATAFDAVHSDAHARIVARQLDVTLLAN